MAGHVRFGLIHDRGDPAASLAMSGYTRVKADFSITPFKVRY
jgi:hypothetical protein